MTASEPATYPCITSINSNDKLFFGSPASALGFLRPVLNMRGEYDFVAQIDQELNERYALFLNAIRSGVQLPISLIQTIAFFINVPEFGPDRVLKYKPDIQVIESRPKETLIRSTQVV